MHDALFQHQDALEAEDLAGYAKSLGLDMAQFARDLQDAKYTKRVRDDFRSGVRSGVNGTPTFFINGSRFEGSWANEKAFVHALQEAAQQSGRGVRTTADANG
jgi:predicted DsbA family dithiol-disulfide isomerase